MLRYAVLILWRKNGVAANFYAFCISAAALPGNNIFHKNFQINFGNNRHKPKRPMIYKLKMAKTGSGAALRLIAFCFAPKMFTQVDRDILEEAKNKIKIENSFLSARKHHQMYMNCTKMYYHVWRQLQLIIHFGLPSPR